MLRVQENPNHLNSFSVLARQFLQGRLQEGSSKECTCVLSVLRIEKQPLTMTRIDISPTRDHVVQVARCRAIEIFFSGTQDTPYLFLRYNCATTHMTFWIEKERFENMLA